MTEDGDVSPLHRPPEAPARGRTVVTDSRPLNTSEDAKTRKENNALKQPAARNPEAALSPYQPRPPVLPRPSKPSRGGSLEETVRTRRLRNSQESLSDLAETGSSTDSLREDQTAPGGLVLDRNSLESGVRPVSAATPGSPAFRDGGSSLSECEQRPRSQHSDPTDLQLRPGKLRLSPVQRAGPLPALDRRFASTTLRAANRIDRDWLDKSGHGQGERLHRNLSDSRLLENMGSDSASVNSLRSTYSVLSPIRPQDVRNR